MLFENILFNNDMSIIKQYKILSKFPTFSVLIFHYEKAIDTLIN
jgi:ATP-dependent protease HslVU (ClpYQ) ATPase subunit